MNRAARWVWLPYALPCAVVWGVALLAFWPAVMSYDSVQQWQQLQSGRLDDWHPAFHTMTNWLITRPWRSPAAVAVVQVATLSFLVGWTVARIRRLGAPRLVCWLVVILTACSPLNATIAITLWKDFAYGVTVLVLTLFVLEIVTSDGSWLDRRGRWIALGSVAALAALFRHNGPAAGLGTLVMLAVAYRSRLGRVTGALLLALVLWLGVRGPLYHAVGVASAGWAPYQPLIHQVAAHIAAGTPLDAGDRAYLSEIQPVDGGWPYSCHWLYPTVGATFRRDVMRRIARDDPMSFVRIWWRLTLRAPEVNLRHLLCSSSVIWWILPSGPSLYATALSIDSADRVRIIDPNDIGLEARPVLPSLTLPLARWIVATQWHPLRWVLWQPAIWMYVLFAGVALFAVVSRRWSYLLVAVPVALHSAGLMIANIGQESRFHYPAHLVGLLVGVLLGAAALARIWSRSGPARGAHDGPHPSATAP